ncbi:hypothetical protein, partial [Achromobacter animicus]|uniref:hypothetical protein n=1 Tax=Achromobacter animicus TaxID=1389935 RepID=UPI0028A9E928
MQGFFTSSPDARYWLRISTQLIIIIVVISIRSWPHPTDASGEILLKHHHTPAALRARLHTRVPAAAALAACLG